MVGLQLQATLHNPRAISHCHDIKVCLCVFATYSTNRLNARALVHKRMNALRACLYVCYVCKRWKSQHHPSLFPDYFKLIANTANWCSKSRAQFSATLALYFNSSGGGGGSAQRAKSDWFSQPFDICCVTIRKAKYKTSTIPISTHAYERLILLAGSGRAYCYRNTLARNGTS